jgi:hypothetical protein
MAQPPGQSKHGEGYDPKAKEEEQEQEHLPTLGPQYLMNPRLKGEDWSDHPQRAHERTGDKENDQRRKVISLLNSAQTSTDGRGAELSQRRSCQDANVVVRAGLNAFEAKGAVEVSFLAWEVESELAPSLE